MFWTVDTNSVVVGHACCTSERARAQLEELAAAVAVVDEHGLVLAVKAIGRSSRWAVTACDRRNEQRRAELGLEPLERRGGTKNRRLVSMRCSLFGHYRRRAA